MPIGPSDLLWIGVLPCVTAAAAMLVCHRVRVRPTAAWAASVGCGFVVGQPGLNARVGWHTALEKLLQPREAHDWLPWAVLVAAGISVLAAYAPRSWQRGIVALACVFAFALPLRLLAGSVYVTARWSAGEKLAVLALWAALFVFEWLTLAAGRANGQPLVRCGLLVLVAIGMAVTIALSGSFNLGKLCGLAAATLLGTAGAARMVDEIHDGLSGAAGPLAVMLGGLVMLGYFYAGLTATNAALLAFAVAAAAGWLPTARLPGPWGESVLRAAVCLVPLAVALASALSTALADTYG